MKAFNGAVQSFAWAVNFGIISNWFPRRGRGVLIGIWATNPNVGDIFGQQLYLLFVDGGIEHWGYTFLTLGCAVELVAVLNLIFLVEYPQKKGIVIREKATILNPDVASDHNDDLDEANNIAAGGRQDEVMDNEEIGNVSFGSALCIRGVLAYSFSFFFAKFAYYGVYYWVPTYLQEKLGYSETEAGNITSLGSVGGIIGSITMGFLSDILNVRSPVHLVASAIGALSLSLITFYQDDSHEAWLTFLLMSFSIFEGGATIVIAIIMCDIGKNYLHEHKKKAVATISGICDGVAGFGSILGQVLLGPVKKSNDWTAAFAMFSGAAIAACLPSIPYTISEVSRHCKSKKHRKESDEQKNDDSAT